MLSYGTRVLWAGLIIGMGAVLGRPGEAHAQLTRGAIIINEIHYAPANSRAEFIELYNASTSPVDLQRLTYADGNLDFDPVTEAPRILQPGEYVVLVRDWDAFSEAFPSVGAIEAPGWEGLNNGGDLVEVRDGDVVVDRVAYDASWSSIAGAALERVDPYGPSDASNFASSTQAATPGRQNSVYAVDISPPVLTGVVVDRDGLSLVAAFDEALDVSGGVPQIEVVGPGAPGTTTVTPASAERLRVRVESALASGEYVLRARGVVDLRGNAGTTERAFTFVRAPLPGPGSIVINEILSRAGDVPEFVEIYNRSSDAVDLRDLALSDASADPMPLSAEPREVPSGQYVVVSGSDVPGETGMRVVLDRWPALNNGGDTVTLWSGDATDDETLTIIDRVDYGAGWGGSRDVSIERIDPEGPSEPFNFASSSSGVTPGRQNSRYAPDRTGPQPVFAEEVRVGGVDAAGTLPVAVDVVFDEVVDPASVQAGAFAVDGRPVLSARLLPGGRTVRVERSGDRAGDVAGQPVRVDGVRDRTGNPGDAAEVLVAGRPRAGDLVINEILFEPVASDRDGRPDQPEYVEVVNRSSRYVSVADLYLTRPPDENGRVDTVAVSAGAAGLQPAEYAVFFAGDGPAAEEVGAESFRAVPPSIADAFPGSRTAAAVWLRVRSTSLRLPNAGGRIRLHAGPTMIDSTAFRPAMHASDLSDTRGVALERISTSAVSLAPAAWTSSADADGGTPGRDNAVFLPERAATARVSVHPSPFSIERDGATRIQYALGRAAASIRVEIYDAQGRHVRTLTSGRRSGPVGEVLWDGRRDDGRRARIGIYVVWLEAVDGDGRHVAVEKVPVVVARPL